MNHIRQCESGRLLPGPRVQSSKIYGFAVRSNKDPTKYTQMFAASMFS